MSLLPKLQQIHDPMPMSLGKAIARAIAPKVDEFKEFENKVFAPFLIKGAAKPTSAKDLEQVAFERWLSRVCTSGDVESVQSQWLASSDYEDFCDEQRPAAPPSTEPGVKFKPGDRVTTLEDGGCKAWILGSLRPSNALSYPGQWNASQEANKCPGILDPKLMKLIEPAPSPDAEGWIPHRPGDPCPIPNAEAGEFLIRYADGIEPARTQCPAHKFPWRETGIYAIAAYKVIA